MRCALRRTGVAPFLLGLVASRSLIRMVCVSLSEHVDAGQIKAREEGEAAEGR